MINLKNISDQLLNQNLKQMVLREREILNEILLHIAEVDRRKLYLTMAYPNLFQYLTKHVGYSEGSAQRRIDAARLSKEIPEIVDSLESGKINMTQVVLLQKAVRQVQTTLKSKVTTETKNEILKNMENKSFHESEVVIGKILNLEIKEAPKVSFQKDESVRFEVTLSKQQWEKMLRMRELLSHSLPVGGWDLVLECLADRIIAQKDKTANSKKLRVNEAKEAAKCDNAQNSKIGNKIDMFDGIYKNDKIDNSEKVEKAKEAANTRARNPIPMKTQRKVFQRDKCCQYQDPITKKKCAATWQLSLDHIQPVWAGGLNNDSNLRLLCANHNRLLYRQQAGIMSN